MTAALNGQLDTCVQARQLRQQATFQNWAFKRIYAANIVCEEARKDARKQFNYIGPLYAGITRHMFVKQANETLEEAKAAFKAQRIKAIKKRQKAEYAAAVAYK